MSNEQLDPDPEAPPDRPLYSDDDLDREEAVKRISALSDRDAIIHGVAFFGEDETYWYYIVVFEREYGGNEYLNERYVQLVKPEAADEREDSWKKNGINRRVTDQMKGAATILTFFYQVVAQREEALRSSLEDGEGEAIDPGDFSIQFVDLHEEGVEDDMTEDGEE